MEVLTIDPGRTLVRPRPATLPVRPRANQSGELTAAVDVCCPRCASLEVQALARIHERVSDAADGRDVPADAALARYAAPPRPRRAAAWVVVVGAAVAVLVASVPRSRAGTFVAVTVVVLAVGLALHALWYNMRVYPSLHALWRRSYMCGRCGEVFARQ